MAVEGIGAAGGYDLSKTAQASMSKTDANAGTAREAEARSTEEKSAAAQASAGGRPAGGGGGRAPGGAKKSVSSGGSSQSSGSDTTYDKRDTNKDGIVSPQEAMQYEMTHPEPGKTTQGQLDIFA